MKKIISIVFLLITLVFASCSKEENTAIIINPPVGYPSELVVKILPEEVVKTKSVGNDDNSYKETRIHNALIATFFSDGSVNVIKENTFNEYDYTKESGINVKFSLKSGNIRTYVVTNIDFALFSTVSSESDLKSVLISLGQDPNNLPMSSYKEIAIEPNKTTTETMLLERISAKVSVATIIDALKTNGYTKAEFKINKVFLHNVNTKSTIDYIGSEIQSGLGTPSLLNYKGEHDYYGNYDIHYFYGFQGNLRLVVGGWFNDGDRAPEYLYYPVDINAIHNTHYQVSITIKGKGVKNPDDKFEPAGKLDLTLKIVDWVDESIDKEFE